MSCLTRIPTLWGCVEVVLNSHLPTSQDHTCAPQWPEVPFEENEGSSSPREEVSHTSMELLHGCLNGSSVVSVPASAYMPRVLKPLQNET
jgi:hypothetical protein